MPDYRLETAMHSIGRDGTLRSAFREDPLQAMAGMPLSHDEKAVLARFDLQAMLDGGVNPLLIQGFWVSIHGAASLGEFVQRMNKCRSLQNG